MDNNYYILNWHYNLPHNQPPVYYTLMHNISVAIQILYNKKILLATMVSNAVLSIYTLLLRPWSYQATTLSFCCLLDLTGASTSARWPRVRAPTIGTTMHILAWLECATGSLSCVKEYRPSLAVPRHSSNTVHVVRTLLQWVVIAYTETTDDLALSFPGKT